MSYNHGVQVAVEFFHHWRLAVIGFAAGLAIVFALSGLLWAVAL